MNTQIEALCAIAEADEGYLEKKSNAQLDSKTANAGYNNWTKFGRDYDLRMYGKTPVLNGQAWCAIGLSDWAYRAGIGPDIIPPHASCSDGISKFKKLGTWYPKSGYTPKRGDIIYYTNDGTSPVHVGLVLNVAGGRAYTIECNTSGGTELEANGGCVAKKNYALTYNRILGYVSPKYAEDKPIEKPIKRQEDDDDMPKYNTVEEVPQYARPTIEKVIQRKGIRGSGTKKDEKGRPTDMGLYPSTVQLLTILDQGGYLR